MLIVYLMANRIRQKTKIFYRFFYNETTEIKV